MTGDGTLVAGRRVADRYRLVAQRDDGEWDAVDETLRRNVVVHILPASADEDEKAHFAAEARALAALPHRNVVATYDTGVDADGSSYRVEELPDGAPLDPHAVDDTKRVSFAIQIARGIAEAHARGLLHGSLTSGSVLVHDDGRVKVCGLHLPGTSATEEQRQADVEAVVNLVSALAPSRPHPLRDMASGWKGDDPPESVSDIVTALVTLPDDDALPLVDPDPTPVAGVTAPRRRVPVGLLVVGGVLVAVGLAIVSLLPGKGGPGDVSGDVRPLKVAASSFDPEANPPTENETEAPLAVDANPATEWRTDRYRRANFANLKDGLGLVLVSQDGLAAFNALRIRTPQAGWTFRVYAAESRAAALSGWGEPVLSGTAEATDFTLELGDVEGGALLLWITEPGPGFQTRIAEIDVLGRV